MNKYKGITLIELVVTLSLLLIIFSIGTFGYGYYNEVKNDLAIRNYSKDIVDILTYSKEYCHNKDITLEIIYKNKSDGIIVEIQDRKEKLLLFEREDDIYFCDVNGIKMDNPKSISISQIGVTTPTTIYLTNKQGNINSISIAVGSNRISYWGE